MIRCRLAVCAESVVRDVETNLISVFNIYEQVRSQVFPILMPKLNCLFILTRDVGDVQTVTGAVQFTVGGEEVLRTPLTVDFQDKFLTRQTIVVQGFPIPAPATA